MTAEAKKMFEQALSLPEQEPVTLIDALADSIVGADVDDVSPDWKAQIVRRIEAVERCDSRLIPGDEVEALAITPHLSAAEKEILQESEIPLLVLHDDLAPPFVLK